MASTVANMSAVMKIGRLGNCLFKHLKRCFLETVLILPFLIVGSPGLGKTDITKGIRKRLEEELGTTVNLVIMHPITKSDVDFAGHPAIVNGCAMHVVYGDLKQLIEATEYTIVLIDDIGQAKLSVQAPIMQLIREREINGHKVSDKVQFVLCTNSQADKAGVTQFLRPLGNRCVAVTVTPDPDALADWLKENYSDVPVVEAFVRHRPGYVLGEFLDQDQIANKIGIGIPTPRSIANVAELMRFDHEIDDLKCLLVGTVGMGFMTEFLGYARVWKTTTKYGQIVNDPTGAKLPSSIDGCYAQVGMLCQQTRRSDIEKVAKFLYRMSNEYVAYFWGICEKARVDLIETATYQEWRMKQKF